MLFVLTYFSVYYFYNTKLQSSIKTELQKYSKNFNQKFQLLQGGIQQESEATSSIINGEKKVYEFLSLSLDEQENQTELQDGLHSHLVPLFELVQQDGVSNLKIVLPNRKVFLDMQDYEKTGIHSNALYEMQVQKTLSGIREYNGEISFNSVFPLVQDGKDIAYLELVYPLHYLQASLKEQDNIFTVFTSTHKKFRNENWRDTFDEIDSLMEKKDSFHLYTQLESGEVIIASFILLKDTQTNKILGYLMSQVPSSYIEELLGKFYQNALIVFFITGLIYFLLCWLTVHQSKIHEERKRFQLAIESSNDGILDWNIKEGTIYYSPQWHTILGYENYELSDSFTELSQRIYEDDKERFQKKLQDLLQGKIEIFECEYRIRHKDGRWLWIFGRAKAHFDSSGKASRVVGFQRDISDKKEFEMKQEALVEEYKNIANAKSDFLSNMSHEIRTPLNAILGFIQVLIKKEDEPKKLKYLTTINESGKSLLRIINEILDFSKLENEKFSIEHDLYDIRQVFQHIRNLFDSSAKFQGLEITLEMDETLPQESYGDKVRIEQIASNILSNAIKFSNKGTTIEIIVSYLENSNSMMCKIKDYGIGISKNKIDDIFSAFTQEDASTTRKYGGTGLGLAISKKLCELMKGEIFVESQVGKGSTFSFTIPLYDVNTQIQKGEVEQIDNEELSFHAEVLIVEDNKTNQKLICLLLGDYGLECTIANDGVEALKMVQERDFDLILMDENMPNMNGKEASKKIREFESENKKDPTPIVAVTANVGEGVRESFIEAGMNDYISKPVNSENLKEVLYKYLQEKNGEV